jgi:hypothetical protein
MVLANPICVSCSQVHRSIKGMRYSDAVRINPSLISLECSVPQTHCSIQHQQPLTLFYTGLTLTYMLSYARLRRHRHTTTKHQHDTHIHTFQSNTHNMYTHKTHIHTNQHNTHAISLFSAHTHTPSYTTFTTHAHTTPTHFNWCNTRNTHRTPTHRGVGKIALPAANGQLVAHVVHGGVC